MPELPRWLADRGRYAEAEAVMAHMESEIVKRTGHPLSSVKRSIVPMPIQDAHLGPIATLFSSEYRMRTIMLSGCGSSR